MAVLQVRDPQLESRAGIPFYLLKKIVISDFFFLFQ